jgi:hypothetical protein
LKSLLNVKDAVQIPVLRTVLKSLLNVKDPVQIPVLRTVLKSLLNVKDPVQIPVAGASLWFSDSLASFEAALLDSFDYGINAVKAIPELEPLIMDKLFWGAEGTLVLNPLRPEEPQVLFTPLIEIRVSGSRERMGSCEF